MARILFLLTRTPWRDFRPYDIQAPALIDAGYVVIYASNAEEEVAERDFDWMLLDKKECKLARRIGALSLYRKVLQARPDIVQLCSLEQLPLGIVLAWLGKCKVVYDCREDMASALYERRNRYPVLIRKMIFKMVRIIEGLADRYFDGVITADPGVYELFDQMPKERKLICYNAALLKQFPNIYPALGLREFELVVLGSMSSHRSGTQDVLDAMNILHSNGHKVKLLLIGAPENEMVDEIQNRIDSYGLQAYVHCTGLLSHSDVQSELIKAKIGIVSLHDYPKFHRNIACKAFEYMACGMPTIASDLPPQRLFLDDSVALFYPPGDVGALAENILSLIRDEASMGQMGNLARKLVDKEWNGDREQSKLKDFYGRLLQLPGRCG